MNYWRPIQLVIGGLLAGVAWGAGEPDWGATVRDLGHAEYRVREQAEAVLRRSGSDAIPFLKQVENSTDPEIRERARGILSDIRLGVTPPWPQEWVPRARQFAALPADERPVFLRQVAERLRSDAVPFLISCALAGEPVVLGVVRELDDPAMAKAVVARLPGEQAGRLPELAAWAHRRLGAATKAWGLLAAARLPVAPDLKTAAIQELVTDWKLPDRVSLAEKVDALVAVAGEDVRLAYFRAAVAGAQRQQTTAARLQKRALNRADASPENRDAAAELLEEIGQAEWARREWERLAVDDSAANQFVVRANLRLGNVYERQEDWAAAADAYADGLAGYRQLSARGVPVVFTAGTETQLVARIEEVRAKGVSRHGLALAEMCRGSPMLGEALTLFMGDESVEAGQVCEQFLASGPGAEGKAAGQYLLGLILFRRGEWARAKVVLESLRQATAPADLDRLLESCERQRRYPLDLPAPPAAKWKPGLVALGDTLFTAKKYAEAAVVYERIREADPDSEAAAYGMLQAGRCYNQLDRSLRSLRCYRWFETEWQGSRYAPAALLRTGVVWAGPLGNPGPGIEIYRRLCARYPTSPEAERAHYYIATSLRWNEDWAEALQEYRCFLELFPHSSFQPYIEEVILPELELHLEHQP